MQLKYRTIKVHVSNEEKLKRIAMYMEDTGLPVDTKEFLNREIFDEYVEMKCLNCNHEETLDFDMLQELMEMYDTDYPEDYCPKCNHGMVPKDLHIQFKKMFNSK